MFNFFYEICPPVHNQKGAGQPVSIPESSDDFSSMLTSRGSSFMGGTASIPWGASPRITFSWVIRESLHADSRIASNFFPCTGNIIIDLENSPAGSAEYPDHCFIEK